LGNVNPLVSLFVSNTRYASLPDFPFQALGFFALLILFLMAATSHDFWLHNLTAPVWKRLHMLVYVAYGLLIAHVTLGALQSETSPLLAALLAIGLTVVTSLHLAAASAERRKDRENEGYIPACAIDDIQERRAWIVSCGGERVAVFKYDGRISAISNVCRHQNGPLGEGKIIDGCVTCPWHGYQYLPDTGASPPPFTERVATYRTRIDGNQVFVDPKPLPPGTRVEPSVIPYAQRI
jgi:nitrite reductase/ring-hydroxylating ferredoxin subunit